MDSLILIITVIFFAAGLAYGRGAGTLTTKDEVLGSITKSWAGLAGLLFLFLLIAQFIAYFNYSNMHLKQRATPSPSSVPASPKSPCRLHCCSPASS